MTARQKKFSNLVALSSSLPTAQQMITIASDNGMPCLTALQEAERVLHQLDSARKHALALVADLAEEYIAQGGDPR